MKYNLRTLKGKRIVGGDPNLATKNEIHVSKIPEELGIEGGGANVFYYKVSDDSLGLLMTSAKLAPSYTICAMKDGKMEEFNITDEYYAIHSCAGYSYGVLKLLDVPYFVGEVVDNDIVNRYICTGDLYDRLSVILQVSPEEVKGTYKDKVSEITKEEYYNIINNL